MQITAADIDEAENSIAKADVLLLQLETPIDASERAAEIAKANDTIVILDPAPARQIPSSLLTKVDILKPNRTEASILSGHTITTPESAIKGAKALQTQISQERYSAIVLTLGEKGVLLCTPQIRSTFNQYQLILWIQQVQEMRSVELYQQHLQKETIYL